jgi:hypothetical protein
MANDFSEDGDVVALWKFDNNANDSIGGNDLTPVNSPTYDSGDKKEGTHSIDFESTSEQICYIDDGDLDAGFPGKGGASEQSFSFCVWAKLESAIGQCILGKWGLGTRSYKIEISALNDLSFHIGYDSGGSDSSITFDTSLSTGIWYHIAVVYDASDNGMKIRVWDDDAGDFLDDNKEGTAGGDMSPDTARLVLGGKYYADQDQFDGKIDEVVIFKRALSDDDIDAIRAGTYGVGTEVVPTTASLTLTTYAPTILVSDHITVTPTTLALTLTGYIPSINIGSYFTPTTLALTLTTFAPTITFTENAIITPSTLSLTLATYAPVLQEVITPTTLALSLTAYAPSVIVAEYFTPTMLALVLATFAPSIHIIGRKLVVKVITSRYRDIKVQPTQYRQIQAITTKGG